MTSDVSIAMVFGFDPSRHGGVAARLRERLAIWESLGQRAHVFACCRPGTSLTELAGSDFHPLTPVIGRNSYYASRRLYSVMKAYKFDVVYLRAIPFPATIRIARNWPTVLEVHGDPKTESTQFPLKSRVFNHLHPTLMRSVEGLLLIDPSLAQSPTYADFPRSRSIITNGVKLPPEGALRRSQRPNARVRSILLAGSNYAWQGIPKYLRIAQQVPESDFLIAGDIEVPLMARTLSNVKVLGPLSPEDVSRTLQSVDFGFGNLSLELVSRRTPSPLKVREYVAQGIPAVIAHDDPDLDGAKGVLNLGYGFTPTAEIIARIRNFINVWRGRQVPESTRQLVSAIPREEARIAYLRQVATRP